MGMERLESRAMLYGYAIYNLVNTSDTYYYYVSSTGIDPHEFVVDRPITDGAMM